MKNKKELKIFLAITLVIVIILVIYFGRNFIIINNISKKEEKLMQYKNYSYNIQGNSGTTTEKYYKNGISKKIIKTADSTLITWKNENTKEEITYFPNTMKADTGINEKGIDKEQIPTLNSGNNLIIAFMSNISSDKINGEECYVVKWNKETTYISKENGIVLKRIGGVIMQDGIETKTTVEYKNWKFNEVTDEEMKKPDLTGYDVSEIKYSYR